MAWVIRDGICRQRRWKMVSLLAWDWTASVARKVIGTVNEECPVMLSRTWCFGYCQRYVAGGPDEWSMRRLELWQKGNLFDLEVKCSGDLVVKASKIDLAVYSGYFKTFFNSQFPDASKQEVNIEGADPNSLECIVRALYEKEVKSIHLIIMICMELSWDYLGHTKLYRWPRQKWMGILTLQSKSDLIYARILHSVLRQNVVACINSNA